MNNLGAYKTMTTMAKRFGGPYSLGATVLAMGYVGGRLVETAIRVAVQHIRTKKETSWCERTIKVTSAGTDGAGVSVNEGDTYCVLHADSDVVLIQRVGEINNPLVVSPEFLRAVSDFD